MLSSCGLAGIFHVIPATDLAAATGANYTPPEQVTIAVGQTFQFAAVAILVDPFRDVATQVIDHTARAGWTSSNEAVASISNAAGSDGLATAKAPGMTTIMATLSGSMDTITLIVVEPARLEVTKTSTPTSIELGAGNVTYTITVRNAGGAPASAVILTDTVPSSMLIQSVASPPGDWTQCSRVPSQTVTCVNDSQALLPGSSRTLTIEVTPQQEGTFTNTATADFTGSTGPVSASATTTVTGAPDTSFTCAEPANVTAGTNTAFSCDLQNIGTASANGTTFTIQLSTGLTPTDINCNSGSCNFADQTANGTVDLAPGQILTIVLNTDVDVFAGNTTQTLQGSASHPGDTTPGNNSQQLLVPVSFGPTSPLTVTKVSNPPSIPLGQNVTYEITVVNTGMSMIRMDLLDQVPASFTILPFPPGSGCTVLAGNMVRCGRSGSPLSNTQVFTITVTPTLTGSFSNTVQVSSDGQGPVQASATTTVTQSATADRSVTCNLTGNVVVEQSANGTCTTSNGGPDATSATTTINVTNATLNSVQSSRPGTTCTQSGNSATCSNPSLPANEMEDILLEITPTSTGPVTVTANVSGDATDSNSQNNTSTATSSAATVNSIAVDPDGSLLTAGSTQQFTAIGNLSDGSSLDITIFAIWSSSNTAVASVSNAAGSKGLVTAAVDAPTPMTEIVATLGQVSDSAPLTVTTACINSISIAPINPTITFGAPLMFTVTCMRSDGSTADITNLAQWSTDDSSILTVSNQPGSKGAATTVTDGTTTVRASALSVTGATLTDSTTVTVNPPSADVFVSGCTAMPEAANVGETSTTTCNLGNNGPDGATGQFNLQLPTGYTVTQPSCSPPNSSCQVAADGNSFSCDVPLSPGSNGTCMGEVTRELAAAGSTVDANASISHTGTDTNAENNTTTSALSTNAAADLTLEKQGQAFAELRNGVFSYELTVRNNGPNPAEGVELTDTLPEGLSFLQADFLDGPGSCAAAGSVVTCDLGAIPSGRTRRVIISVSVQQAGSYTNTATVTSTTFDPTPNPPASATTTVHPSIEVRPDTATVAVGEVVQLRAFAISDLSEPDGIDVTEAVTWFSESVGIATVSNASGSEGQVTGVAVGENARILADAATGARGLALINVVEPTAPAPSAFCALAGTFDPSGGLFAAPINPADGTLGGITMAPFPAFGQLAAGGQPGAPLKFAVSGGVTLGDPTTLSAFQEDPTTCTLTQLGTVTLAAGGRSIAAFENTVFAGYDISGTGGVRVLTFDQTTGFTEVEFFSTNSGVIDLAVHPNGTHLVAAVGENIQVFSIDAVTKTLTRTQDVSPSVFGLSPINVRFNADGTRLYVRTSSPRQVSTAPFVSGALDITAVTAQALDQSFPLDMEVRRLNDGSDAVYTVFANADPNLHGIRCDQFTTSFSPCMDSPYMVPAVEDLSLRNDSTFALLSLGGAFVTWAFDANTGAFASDFTSFAIPAVPLDRVLLNKP